MLPGQSLITIAAAAGEPHFVYERSNQFHNLFNAADVYFIVNATMFLINNSRFHHHHSTMLNRKLQAKQSHDMQCKSFSRVKDANPTLDSLGFRGYTAAKSASFEPPRSGRPIQPSRRELELRIRIGEEQRARFAGVCRENIRNEMSRNIETHTSIATKACSSGARGATLAPQPELFLHGAVRKAEK